MRVNLEVSFHEKDVVKSLGGRWDVARKLWYVENVENLMQFRRWIPKRIWDIKSSPAPKVTHLSKPKNTQAK